MDEFKAWLNKEVNARGWSRAEAARRGGFSAPLFEQVMNGQTKPGMKFCRGIAKAFGISTEDVMRRAGLLPTYGDILPEARAWSDRLRALDEDKRSQAIDVIERLVRILEGRP